MSEQTNDVAVSNGRHAIGLEALQVARLRDKVEVDGYPGYFLVQEITYIERMGYRNRKSAQIAKKQAAAQGGTVEEDDNTLLIPYIVALGWIKDDGSKVCEHPEGGATLVAQLPSRVTMALYNRIGQLSEFLEEERKDAGKDLSGTPSESGGTASA
jgi:hypothetical protein